MAKDYDHLFKLLIIGDSGKLRLCSTVPFSTNQSNPPDELLHYRGIEMAIAVLATLRNLIDWLIDWSCNGYWYKVYFVALFCFQELAKVAFYSVLPEKFFQVSFVASLGCWSAQQITCFESAWVALLMLNISLLKLHPFFYSLCLHRDVYYDHRCWLQNSDIGDRRWKGQTTDLGHGRSGEISHNHFYVCCQIIYHFYHLSPLFAGTSTSCVYY